MKMGNYFILILVVMFLLVACTGRTMRSIAPQVAPNREVTEGSSEKQIQSPSEESIPPVPSETYVVEPRQMTTEVPSETTVVVKPITPASTAKQSAVVILESENAYTDLEKKQLLDEIDLLLEETLKDLGQVGWNDLPEGGQ